MVLLPLFPAGEAVTVTDRGLSMTAEMGMLIAARVDPVGGFHFVRACGDPLPAEREGSVVRALERGMAAWDADGQRRGRDPAARRGSSAPSRRPSSARSERGGRPGRARRAATGAALRGGTIPASR